MVAFSVDDDGNLEPIEDASALGSVSSFLPLIEERSGAKFLIQADFLVQPGREAIQYQLSWNRWLLDEATKAVIASIELFKANTRWRRQFLRLFHFTTYKGQRAFDELFGPHLVSPLLEHLKKLDVVPVDSGGFVRPDMAVFPEPGLVGLVNDADLGLLFPLSSGLKVVDPSLNVEALPAELRQTVVRLSFETVARNLHVLKRKLGLDEWFLKFYTGMAATGRDFRQIVAPGRRRGYSGFVDSPIYILTDSNTLSLANGVHLRTIPPEVSKLRREHTEVDKVLRTYTLIHPSLDTPTLNAFFKDKTQVTAIDFERICRDVFLKMVRIQSPAPKKEELLAYTMLLQKGPRINEPIWALTTSGDIKPSNQLFFGTIYSPAENWQKNHQYAPHIDFLSEQYLRSVPTTADRPRWKSFFTDASVKEVGQANHVEMFAMALVEQTLSMELTDFVAKNRQQVGYDREARRKKDGALIKMEIKGLKKDAAVQLIGNEPTAAHNAANNEEPFWVCIVTGIPEMPQLWVVDNAVSIGRQDTLTIDVVQWRTHGRRVI